MIAERIQQSYTSAKYYQFYAVATILEHVIDCFHTIVSDETNPYHPPLSWLTRKQLKPPRDELFCDLFEECSTPKLAVGGGVGGNGRDDSNFNGGCYNFASQAADTTNLNAVHLSSSVQSRLDKCSRDLRKNIVSRTKDGCSPLFMACKLGHHNIVKYLLDSCDADIEQKGRFETIEDHHVHSVSPLWVATVSGHLNVVKLLIEYNANVNSLSDTGSTPLRSVCFLCKDDDCAQQPDDDYDNNGVADVYFEIVKLLVENGAEISRPNFNGGTCLINSTHNYRLTEFIIDHGGDVNASDNQSKTALHYAIQRGRLEVTKLLLSRGANPMLRANFCDDALQLACLGGNLEIFQHLIKTIDYPKARVSDAYKLLGSSILEHHYDLSKVRQLWKLALQVQGCDKFTTNNPHSERTRTSRQLRESGNDNDELSAMASRLCDIRRSTAFCDNVEFNTESELQSLSADDFRIQSLLISERILGSDHRETIQRLLYRGTFYLNSLRPDRCLDLWIYALQLRLKHESIFHFESIFAAQAISRLLLDLFSQNQEVKFQDVYDVVSLLSDQLDECATHLNQRPASCLHEEIYDLLLGMIVNFLFALKRASAGNSEHSKLTCESISKLVKINPRTSNGSSLLHVCIAPSVLDGGDALKVIAPNSDGKAASPVIELIDTLLGSGLDIDLTNCDGLSALQVLCSAGIRLSDKSAIMKHLVENGAHVDRRPSTPEQGEVIRQTLKEAGVDPMEHLTLACLAARKLAESKIRFDERMLTKSLKESIAIH